VARTLTAARSELAAADPVMAELIERLGDRSVATRRRGAPKPDAYGALLRTVVAQQVSSKAARAIYQRVLDLFGGTTPSPDQILATSEADLRTSSAPTSSPAETSGSAGRFSSTAAFTSCLHRRRWRRSASAGVRTAASPRSTSGSHSPTT
jgi:3-methyladenine DNA glycosylase/8-oxoguanine DNA glycosylase